MNSFARSLRRTALAAPALALLVLPIITIKGPAFAASTVTNTLFGFSTAESKRRIDTTDPWADPGARALAIQDLPRMRSRPIDTTDPWTGGEWSGGDLAEEPRLPGALAKDSTKDSPGKDSIAKDLGGKDRGAKDGSAASGESDRALRRAIKAAVDAGELERASALLEVLRGVHRE